MVEAGAGDSVRKARKWVQEEEGSEETESQAGGNAPRGGAWARRVAGYGRLSQPESGEASGSGGFPHQAGQGGQVGPDVSQEDEGFPSWQAIDGQAFKFPVFDGGIATFGGIASTVIEAFPGGRTDGDVTHEADGVIGETFTHVDDLSVGMISGLKGALVGWIEGTVHGGDGGEVLETSLITEPFVALAVRIEAVGGEGVAEGTDRASFVVVAADRPQRLVLVRRMGTQVNDAFGAELVDRAQEDVVAQASVAGDRVWLEVRVEGSKLKQEGRGRVFLSLVGGLEIIQQDDVEATGRVGQLEG